MPLPGRLRGASAPDPQAILRVRPFAQVATLERIEPLEHDEAHSGGAFLALAADGRRFKLRVCPDERRAREIAACLRGLPRFFPALVAREGRLLLIEYLEGRRVEDRKELRPFAHELGRTYAEIHRLGALRGPRGWLRGRLEAARARFQITHQLRSLRRLGLLDTDLAARARGVWRQWRRRYGVPIALELYDAGKANFMIDAAGALRYVDEEGLRYTLRGMGLAKLLADPGVRPDSPKHMREFYRFCQGYAEVADAGYLTPDYCDSVRVLELVRSLEFKLRSEARLFKVEPELDELRALLERVKPVTGSSDPSGAPVRGPGAP